MPAISKGTAAIPTNELTGCLLKKIRVPCALRSQLLTNPFSFVSGLIVGSKKNRPSLMTELSRLNEISASLVRRGQALPH
jgi:hypothetical protein